MHTQLLGLYAAGSLAGAVAHLAYHWYDAGGFDYGSRYALNTPAFLGCSGGVAAVLGFKFARAPAAMTMAAVLPVPISFALFVYCCLETKEAVSRGRVPFLIISGGGCSSASADQFCAVHVLLP